MRFLELIFKHSKNFEKTVNEFQFRLNSTPNPSQILNPMYTQRKLEKESTECMGEPKQRVKGE